MGRSSDLDEIYNEMRRDKGFGGKKSPKRKTIRVIRCKGDNEHYSSEGGTSSQSTPRPLWTLTIAEVAEHPFV